MTKHLKLLKDSLLLHLCCQSLGFILRQQDASANWTLIQAGFQFLTDAESRYDIIELEMLPGLPQNVTCF